MAKQNYIRVGLIGDDAMKQALENSVEQVMQNVKTALDAQGDPLASKAKSNLKSFQRKQWLVEKSLVTKTTVSKKGYKVSLKIGGKSGYKTPMGDPKQYMFKIEYGAKGDKTKSGKQRTVKRKGVRYNVVGQQKREPRPFIIPAIKDRQAFLTQVVEKAVMDTLAQVQNDIN